MSEENVEVAVRQVTEPDADEVTELFALAFHKDPTWSWAFPDPEKRMDVVYGKDAVRSFYEAIAETVGHDSVIDDPIDAGDSVVVRVRTHMTGEHSGLEGQMEYSLVLAFRRGKAVMAEYFWDHQEALEAAGLPE